MGRAWVTEANQGNGPLWTEYFHHFVDEELQAVATQQGAFWQRPDLSQYHHYWGREGEVGIRPVHLQDKDRPEKWQAAKRLFNKRKAAGFRWSEKL
jgi:hypothetical protein